MVLEALSDRDAVMDRVAAEMQALAALSQQVAAPDCLEERSLLVLGLVLLGCGLIALCKTEWRLRLLPLDEVFGC
jgi:hypothetical protein